MPIILLTAFSDVKDAVKFMKWGASDYLTKPLEIEELTQIIKRVLRETSLRTKPGPSQKKEKQNPLYRKMGSSKSIESLVSEVVMVGPTDFSVLIIGETGTGKELVARELHRQSGRPSSRFVAVDCGAIPESLFESELLGHNKGAFTGAEQSRKGKFALASGGTLFLDEISNLPYSTQSKLLRVLQEKSFYPLGENHLMEANFRPLAATNENLIDPSEFRRDLYYRLAEYVIHLPALRDRKEDLPFLCKRLIKIANRDLKKNVLGISDRALSLLFDHSWPGNVRELQNVIRKAVLLARDTIEISHIDLPCKKRKSAKTEEGMVDIDSEKLSLKELVDQNTSTLEKKILLQVLEKTGGNRSEAARILQIDYKTMLSKIKKYKISLEV